MWLDLKFWRYQKAWTNLFALAELLSMPHLAVNSAVFHSKKFPPDQGCQISVVTAASHDVLWLFFPLAKPGLGVASAWHIRAVGRTFDSHALDYAPVHDLTKYQNTQLAIWICWYLDWENVAYNISLHVIWCLRIFSFN